jgi:ABC-type polysaccharide/polyol phosphate transport system ATPase subunit
VASVAVDVQEVSKRFRLYHEKYTSLKEKIIHAGRVPYEDLWALQEVAFEVREGETVGILGRNGSGKSTLLKCVCGVLQPTSGRIVVRGKLAGLLELGAGFQQELSGRENIYLNGSMLGLSKREVDRLFDDIVEFAELGQFIDNQVKFYSSGMYVRLGFAVAVNVDPDVLVIDEVLAVGDERFQRKCMDRIKRFQREGRTILFVSHSPDQVRSICDRAVVLSHGKMIGLGAPGEAVRLFRESLMEAGDELALGGPEEAPAPTEPLPGPPGPPVPPAPGPAAGHVTLGQVAASAGPSRPVRLGEVEAHFPEQGDRRYLVPGESLVVRVHYEAEVAVDDIMFSIEVRQDDNSLLFRSDTQILGVPVVAEAGPGVIDFHIDALPLYDGNYDINIGIYGPGGILYDWREPACQFEMMNPGRSVGLLELSVRPVPVPADRAGESERMAAGA